MAARILGFVKALFTTIGVEAAPCTQRNRVFAAARNRIFATLRDTLGADFLATLMDEGATMTEDEIVEAAAAL
jgi:hypothetical protein